MAKKKINLINNYRIYGPDSERALNEGALPSPSNTVYIPVEVKSGQIILQIRAEKIDFQIDGFKIENKKPTYYLRIKEL